MESLQKYISAFRVKKYYLLGIYEENKATTYNLILAVVNNNDITIEAKYRSNSLNIFEENKLKKDIPVILYIDDSNIINKITSKKEDYRKKLLFKEDEDSFYFYEYHQGNYTYASIARKEYIDQFVSGIREEKFFVVHLAFGPYVIANLLPVLHDDTYHIKKHHFVILNNQISNYFILNQKKQKRYLIGDENLESYEIPLFATLLAFLFPSDNIENKGLDFKNNIEEIKYATLLRYATTIGLASIIMMIIIGQIFLIAYSKELAEKSTENYISQQSLKEVEKLSSEVTLKKSILETSGISNNSYLVKYISQIGNTVSPDIILTSIEVRPTIKKIKPDVKINFAINTIYVSGTTTNDTSFNDWIKNLGNLEWINKTDINEYYQERSNVKSFSLKIRI